MIRSLRGVVVSVDGGAIIMDVSGFGIEVMASGTLLASAVPGESMTCSAWLHATDSGMSMFGFSDDVERALFVEIMKVKNMGPKTSIALLRHLEVSVLVSAILAGDANRLAVPGIGPKTADQICYEMRPRVEKRFAHLAEAGAASALRGPDAEVVDGLVGLGFSRAEAARAVAASRAEASGAQLTEEALMMAALSRLKR